MVEIYDLTRYSNDRRQIDEITSNQIETKIPFTQITVITNAFGGTGASATKTDTKISSQSLQITKANSPQNTVSASVLLSIGLPLPNELTYSYKNDWSDESTSIAGNILSQFTGSGVDFSNLKDLASNAAIRAGSETIARKKIKDSGLAANPLKEMFYSGVEFRTFDWTWEFAPVNEQESKYVQDLIKKLVYHSHPDYRSGPTSPFLMPDTFEVEFVNTKLPKIKQLALVSVSPNYANSGNGAKFFSDGSPAFVSLALSFLEISLLTKDELDKLEGTG